MGATKRGGGETTMHLTDEARARVGGRLQSNYKTEPKWDRIWVQRKKQMTKRIVDTKLIGVDSITGALNRNKNVSAKSQFSQPLFSNGHTSWSWVRARTKSGKIEIITKQNSFSSLFMSIFRRNSRSLPDFLIWDRNSPHLWRSQKSQGLFHLSKKDKQWKKY